MTRLCVDPATLWLQYARASPESAVRIRAVAQVSHYDSDSARLYLVRCANLGRAEFIDIDGGYESAYADGAVAVDVSGILDTLGPHHVAVGAVVSVWGMFDGNEIYAVECSEVDGGAVATGSAIMAEIAALDDLNDL